MLPGRDCQPRAAAWLLLPLLAACAAGTPPPPYVQTKGSRAAFSLFEQVQAGARRDLVDAARGAGLVDEGVCREVGARRLYCHALRFTEVKYYGPSNDGPSLVLAWEEVRFCLAPSQAVGFLAGSRLGGVPDPLMREYPEEFATVPGAAQDRVETNPDLVEATSLEVTTSMTELSANEAVRRLGYGGPGSRFYYDESSRHTGYRSYYYPGHAEGIKACSTL